MKCVSSYVVDEALKDIERGNFVEEYENAEFYAINVANWERAYASYDYAKDFAEGAAFGADLIIGRIGENANSCSMCKRLIINAGIEKVYIRVYNRK